MKRILTILFAVAVAVVGSLSLISCKDGAGGSNPDNDKPQTEYCTVTFDSDGGAFLPAVRVKKGEKVEKPSLCTKSDDKYDYELKRWQNGSLEWDFLKNAVTQDITLKAVWEAVGTSKEFLPQD